MKYILKEEQIKNTHARVETDNAHGTYDVVLVLWLIAV